MVWERKYGGSTGTYKKGVGLLALDDGFAILGNTPDKGAGADDLWLLRTDLSGNLLWDKTYGGPYSDGPSAISADATGFILSGSTGTEQGTTKRWPWVVHTDKAGTVLWEHKFYPSGFDTDSADAPVVANTSSGILVGAWFQNPKNLNRVPMLAQLDSNGNELWSRTFPANASPSGLAVMPSGIVLSGSRFENGADGWLLRTDPWGNSTCAAAGLCTDLTATDCDDKNPCTADLCDAAHGVCWHQTLDDGAACSTGKSCTVGETCEAGVCQGGGERLFSKAFSTGAASQNFSAILARGESGFFAAGGDGGVGAGDGWLVSLGQAGDIQWTKTYGGTKSDGATSLVAVDGGLLMGGNTSSSGAGLQDAWLVRLNEDGSKLWEKTYGGSGNEGIASVVSTTDKGFAFVGTTQSKGTPAPGFDAWLVRTDSTGAVVWDKAFPGGNVANPNDLVGLSDGGFAFCGATSQNNKWIGAWLVRVDALGSKVWEHVYADASDSYRMAALPGEAGFALIGSSQTTKIWALRTSPTGDVIWQRTLEGQGAHGLIALADGSVVIGAKFAGGDSGGIRLAHLDPAGNLLWSVDYASPTMLAATPWDLAHTPAGNLALAGWASQGGGIQKAFLMRTDPWGNATCATSGPCAALAATACSDANPCTTDLCDAAHNGCYHTPLADGSPCGGTKACAAGVCK